MDHTGVTQRRHVADQLTNIQDLRRDLMNERAEQRPNSERARFCREDIGLSLKLAEVYAQLYVGEQLERVIAALKPARDLIPGAEPAYADVRPEPTFTEGAYRVPITVKVSEHCDPASVGAAISDALERFYAAGGRQS